MTFKLRQFVYFPDFEVYTASYSPACDSAASCCQMPPECLLPKGPLPILYFTELPAHNAPASHIAYSNSININFSMLSYLHCVSLWFTLLFCLTILTA